MWLPCETSASAGRDRSARIVLRLSRWPVPAMMHPMASAAQPRHISSATRSGFCADRAAAAADCPNSPAMPARPARPARPPAAAGKGPQPCAPMATLGLGLPSRNA